MLKALDPRKDDDVRAGPVNMALQDSVAIITMVWSPVNALGAPLRLALQRAMREAIANPASEAIIITGAGKLFSGGADISEFQSDLGQPDLPQLLNEIAASRKPVIAAINGAALGGGLELALACHARIAAPAVKLSLPEVSLGLIPGAGGTQRLPRIVGLVAALDIITTGKPITAPKALEIGLLDRVSADAASLLNDALAFARDLKDAVPLSSALAQVGEDNLDIYRAKLTRTSNGRQAPLRAMESVVNATLLPLEDGLAREKAIFLECNASAEARALQHLFFAERKASQVRDMPVGTQARPINTVAVIGAGTMGGGIAMSFLNAGIAVTILDLDAQGLERGIGMIRTNYEISLQRGRFKPAQVEQALSLLTGATQYDAIGDADLVIEAIYENMDAKKAVFAAIDAVAKPGAILATNTSSLDVNAIASATTRPQDVIGLHFFSPANVMRLVEIVRARESAPDTLKTALDLCKSIGKVGVVVGVCFGFVGNRMLEPYAREGYRLLLEGSSPEAIDRVLTGFGWSMGIFAMHDMAGLDVGALIRQGNQWIAQDDPSYGRIGDVLAGRGHYGQKTGRGFYLYEGRERRSNPDLASLVAAEAEKLGIVQRAISDQEILERCLFPLVDEGLRTLEEGISQRPGDIDTIWCKGYGFPTYRGGPMHWADAFGPAAIHRAMEGYRQSLGDYGARWFAPSTSLVRAAEEDRTINELFASD